MPVRDTRDVRDEKTLWDEFAMAALTGLLAEGNLNSEGAVVAAYHIADLMLEQREV